MATNTPTQQQSNTVKQPRPEMWLITLAKSKIMRFFAVSCEFIIFLGCLWLTLVTILPSATTWLWGGVDTFFMVAMGFAVDAALPEAWLHVVDQYLEKKKAQLRWSIPIAVAMLVLVIANVVYTKLTGQSEAHPTGAMEAVVNTLLIARMFIGISYVTIRECQSFIDRKQYNQAPPAQSVPVEELIKKAADELQTQVDQRLTELAGNQKQSLDLFRIEQQRLLSKVQDIEASVPALDYDAIARAMMPYLKATFQNQARAITEEVQGRVKAILEESQRPGPQRQLEARATGSQPALKLLNKARPEPEARANGTPEERLQAAYEVLLEGNQRVSGRALARLAHVSRDTAGLWLAEVKGQQEEPDPDTVIEADCEIETIALGQ